MQTAPSDLLDVLGRHRAAVTALLREADGAAARAAGLAAALRPLWPSAPLCACLFRAEGEEAAAAADSSGAARPEWAAALRAALGPVAPAPDAARAPAPAVLAPAVRSLVVAPLAALGEAFGALAVAAPEADAAAAPLLAACAGQAALLLARDEQARELRRLRQDLDMQEWAAEAGELAGPIAHEVNNCFNVILLQVAVMEQQAPEAARADLAEVRRQGKATAALVKRWQGRRRPAAGAGALDLNRVVREAAEAVRGRPDEPGAPAPVRLIGPDGGLPDGPGVPVLLDLAQPSPRAAGPAPDLRRLAALLLKNAAAAAPGGAVAVRTRQAGGRAVLVVEDTGPPVPADRLAAFFEPSVAARDGAEGMELAACHAIARRLGGRASVANAASGVAVTVELPAA
jgi:signal transduction histidine kinase